MTFFKFFDYDELEERKRAIAMARKLGNEAILQRVVELLAEDARDEEACSALSDGTKAVIIVRGREKAVLLFVLMREKYGAKLYQIHDDLVIAVDKAKLNEFLKNEGVFIVVDQERVKFVSEVELDDSTIPVLIQEEPLNFIYDLMYVDREDYMALCSPNLIQAGLRAQAESSKR